MTFDINGGIPGLIVVLLLVDAFCKMDKEESQYTVSKSVIFVQLSANLLYAAAFSVFTILITEGIYWAWYLKTVFDFISLLILMLILISIVKF